MYSSIFLKQREEQTHHIINLLWRNDSICLIGSGLQKKLDETGCYYSIFTRHYAQIRFNL